MKIKFCFFLSIYSRCGARWLLGPHDTLPCVLIKIADFGMARDMANENYYITSGGKIPVKWTAPEVVMKLTKLAKNYISKLIGVIL